ncbi:MAG: hypothetical protein IMZ50_10825 [Candidatus Atribacteria bacterium]|nr:hypothetical protein [Candidatus Atribacteria bacterium]
MAEEAAEVIENADPDVGEAPDAELEAKVGAQLAALNGDEPVKDAEEADGTPDPDEKPEAKEEAAVEDKPKTPTLPRAYVRAAKYYGVEEDEINELFETSPDLALKHYGAMARSMSAETASWAKLGREKSEQVAAEVRQTAEARKAAGKSDATSIKDLLKPVDVDALIEQFGNPDLIRTIVGPMNDLREALAPMLEKIEGSHGFIGRMQAAQTRQLLDGFFSAGEMSDYGEFYGADTGKLTEDQCNARNKVLVMADNILTGSRERGRELSMEQALQIAHDSVTAGIKTETIRKSLKKSVVARGKGLSLKPSHRGGADVPGAPKTEKQLEAAAKSNLARLFG